MPVQSRPAAFAISLLLALGTPARGAVANAAGPPAFPVAAAAVPTQAPVAAPPIALGPYRLMPVARFEGAARVLSRRDYASGHEAAISPTDLALGWGRMADPRVVGALRISQADRWYFFSYARAPIPHAEIVRSSANMHFIPASDAVAALLSRVRPGDVVEFRGSLVDASRANGWSWRTSRTRDDSGAGACELVYVETLRILR